MIGADQPAGFHIEGQIEKSADDEITVPPLAARIGRQALKKESDTILTAADNDGTFSSFSLGGNYYIYALRPADDSDGQPDFILSENSTYPDGYTPDNSRKIGGFHYGRIRNVLWADSEDIEVNILPNSVWDLKNRPTCDPTGMAKVGDIWVDIYLVSESDGDWPDTKPVSEYNAIPITGSEDYCGYDFMRLASNGGKRLLTYAEWIQAAYGSPEGNDNNNDAAWTDESNNSRTETGTVEQAVSIHNIVDCVGNVYEWLDSWNARNYNDNWDNNLNWHDVLDAGKDEGQGFGEAYMEHERHLVMVRAGGRWDSGSSAGARCVGLGSRPWDVDPVAGCRFACDSSYFLSR